MAEAQAAGKQVVRDCPSECRGLNEQVEKTCSTFLVPGDPPFSRAMPRTHGTFYFKLTTAGHLLGEYSNPGTPRARPECAFRGDQVTASDRVTFIGEYISTWYEPGENPEAVAATLEIAAKSASADPTTQFTLTWTSRIGQSMF